jgi:hypothetical protein
MEKFSLKSDIRPPTSDLSSAVLSLSIHILIIALLLFFETPHKKTFEKYMTVRIVSTVSTQSELPSPTITFATKPNISSQAESPSDNGIKEPPSPQLLHTPPRLVQKEPSRKEQIIEEALHAIKAKKRIEKIARLRAEISGQMSEVRNQRSGSMEKYSFKSDPRPQTSDLPSDLSPASGYVKIVTDIIHSNWTYPESRGRGLKGSVVILIERNGSVKIKEFNSSGDRLFDYSIRNAILKSTLPPPPEELEIEVRFTQ